MDVLFIVQRVCRLILPCPDLEVGQIAEARLDLMQLASRDTSHRLDRHKPCTPGGLHAAVVMRFICDPCVLPRAQAWASP